MAQKIDRKEYDRYLHSEAWRALRQQALKLAGFHCGRCPARKTLQVHHRTYERFGAERLEDLLVLCDRCHRREHGIGRPKKRRGQKRKRRYVSVRFVDPKVLRVRGTEAALEHAFWSGYERSKERV